MTSSATWAAHTWDENTWWHRYAGKEPTKAIQRLFERPVLGLAIYSILLIAVYILIELCVGATSAIPLDSYASPIATVSALSSFGWTARLLILLFLVMVVLLDPMRLRWHDFSGGQHLRIAICVLAVSMAWPLTTYGYNYAVDSSHLFDRGLLFLLLTLLVWRPVFVFPFLLTAYIIFAQLTAPTLGGSILAHKTQVLRAIELFTAFYVIKVVTGYHRTSGFVFVLGCYVAVAYWLPALAKIQIDWLSHNTLNLVPLAAYAHGWRSDQSPQQIVEFGESLRSFAPVFQTFALAIEAAFIIFVVKYRFSLFLLFAAIVFHFGVFYLFGFFFWTWIILDLVLIGLILSLKKTGAHESCFGFRFVPLGALLIVVGPYWAKPPALAWYDTPLSYTYVINAQLDNGDEVRLAPKFFAPYEDVFTMTGFNYLVDQHGILVGPYGVTNDQDVFLKLLDATSFDEVIALENAQSWESYNETRSEQFYGFLENFVRNRNASGDKLQGLYTWHSPLQFWSSHAGKTRLESDQVKAVTIVEHTYFFDGSTLRLVREIPLRTIDTSTSTL